MPPPVSLQEAQRNLVSFGTSREREFFRYLPPSAHPQKHITRDTSVGIASHPSSDPSLSAFAQLGALRISAQRAVISLFGRSEEHIIAEATQSMSLRIDNNQHPLDDLLFGVCTMSYSRSLSSPIANSTPSPAQPPVSPVLIVPDLTQDDAYRNHPDVTGFPNLRFLASAPIVSPKGVVIGAYTVLHDEPRNSLCPGLVDFLADMAAIVVNHLDHVRSQTQHQRGERMMVGLGSFLEGKGGLRSGWLDETEAVASPHFDAEAEGSINTKQQDKQRVGNISMAMRSNKDGSTTLPLRQGYNKLHAPDGQTDQPQEHQRTRQTPKFNKSRPVSQPPTSHGPIDMTARTKHEETKSSKEAFDTQVEETFARAANIIRESLEVEAAVFFDPKFNGQGTFVTNSKSDVESGLENSSADEEMNATKPEIQSKLSHSVMGDSGRMTLNPSKIMGFATSNAASVNDESQGDPNISLSQSFLAGLLRRYPRGKIFNFGEDGSISSNDSSDSVFKDFNIRASRRYKKTRKSVLLQDALTLLNIASGSRSIIFSPIWDTHKSRWYAATLLWTRVPQRILTVDDELTFCTAFGNSLMAEVHRLRALFTERATADLLAGLSHELRSPLHGIGGVAELLNDTAIDALQRGFVHTIISCATTLLGSIDQLLEYSSINDLQGVSGMKHPPLCDDRYTSQTTQVDSTSIVSLDVAIEDTVETVWAGHSFLRESGLPTQGPNTIEQDRQNSIALQSSVQLIFDIDSSSNWRVATRPGAWNVILTNIVGNALKYTQQGYVYVSVKMKPVHSRDHKDSPRSTVTINVQDTGCGMDSDFLQDGYFTAFSQENDNVPGNGLGANITKRTVSSLGGDLKVSSQRGIGTEVTISVTVDHVSDHASIEAGLDNYPAADYLAPARCLMSQKTVGIIGLEDSQLGNTISSSLQKIGEEWLQMNVCVVAASSTEMPRCDFYIAPYEFLDVGNLAIQSIIFDSNLPAPPPLIVICSTPKLARSLFVASRERGDSEILEFITQPCGPRKLAKLLETCLKRHIRRVAGLPTPGPSMPSSFQKSDSQIVHASVDKLRATPERYPLGNLMANSEQNYSEPRGRANSLLGSKDYFSFHNSPPIATRPLSPSRDSEATPPMEIHPSTAPEQDSIVALLVDDNPVNMSLLVAFVKKLGIDYLTAQNGQEALDAFKKHSHRVRIVLMDISMPIMDGLESTRQIRVFENTLKQPSRAIIVALTGVAQADVQRDAMASGMDLFLTKPVRLKVISQVIHNYTGIRLPLPHRGKCLDSLQGNA